MYKAFLIKYGEIGTKGKNRYIFEDMLVHQIRHALKKVEGTFDVTKENGRIYVEGTNEFDDEEAINALRKVFGILWICPMLQVKDEGFDKLAEDVIDYLRTMYRGKKMTFKVNARRARKNYPLDSMGINMAICKYRNQKQDKYLYRAYTGTGRNACRNQRQGNASVIGRH